MVIGMRGKGEVLFYFLGCGCYWDFEDFVVVLCVFVAGRGAC